MARQNFTSIQHLIDEQMFAPGAPTKEVEPIGKEAGEAHLQEIKEPSLPKEVQDYIQKRDETINLPPDLKQIGVVSTGQAAFTTTAALPLTDDKIMKGLHAPLTSSLRWLAEFCRYILRQAHITLKEMQGKVVRTGAR